MKVTALFVIFYLLFGFPVCSYAQTEPEDIAMETDAFQDSFYESLLQKGIENYDKAILALEKCLKLQPNNATLYSELGRNYLAQKDYKKAFDSFEKATQLDPKNRWFWVGMYDVCYETRDFVQAIEIVIKLVEFKKEYKEELVSLYMNTLQFDKALLLINELNDRVGRTDLRENYKAQILRNPQFQSIEITNLVDQIKKNPKEEANYIALIFLYSEIGQEEKAQQVAQSLENQIPSSEWAQVSLFKSYLSKNDGPNVVKSMNSVLASVKIDTKIKHRILNEFLLFTVDKPQFNTDLEKAISYFDTDKEVLVAKEIGKFYHNKKNWNEAIKYYELQLKKNTNDLETVLLLLQVYTEKGEFNSVAKKSETMLLLFPAQPEFYYYNGMAYNQLKNYKIAKDILEMGLEFLVNDPILETNFNIQLGEAYNGLGNMKKKEEYFYKAENSLKQRK